MKAFSKEASSKQAKNIANLVSTENSPRDVVTLLHLLNVGLVISVNTGRL